MPTSAELASLLHELIEQIEQLNQKGDPICPDCSNVAICPQCEPEAFACERCKHAHCPTCGDELLCPDCDDCDDDAPDPCKGHYVMPERSDEHTCTASPACGRTISRKGYEGHSLNCPINELLIRAKAVERALEDAYLRELPDGPELAPVRVKRGARVPVERIPS